MDTPLTRRRGLRRPGTDSENVLWVALRSRRFEGFKFRRQHPCGPYIVDFFCAAHRLVVELDGGQHFEPLVQAYDARRTAFLARRGLRVLRFQSDAVFHELPAVLEVIATALARPPSP